MEICTIVNTVAIPDHGGATTETVPLKDVTLCMLLTWCLHGLTRPSQMETWNGISSVNRTGIQWRSCQLHWLGQISDDAAGVTSPQTGRQLPKSSSCSRFWDQGCLCQNLDVWCPLEVKLKSSCYGRSVTQATDRSPWPGLQLGLDT